MVIWACVFTFWTAQISSIQAMSCQMKQRVVALSILSAILRQHTVVASGWQGVGMRCTGSADKQAAAMAFCGSG